MLFTEYISKNKNFTPKLGTSVKAKEIRDQSSRHSTRRGDLSILDKVRPGQSNDVNKYLKETYRNVTEQLYDKIVTESNTIFNNAGFYWDYPIALEEHYKEQKIRSGKTMVSFMKYVSSKLIDISFTDPNGLIIPFPIEENNIIPSNLPENAEIKCQDRILKSNEYSAYNDFIIFLYKEEKTDSGLIHKYIAVDSKEYVLYTVNGSKTEQTLWYRHNLGYIPCTELPSKQIEDKEDDIIHNKKVNVTYNESFIQGVFELLDKALLSSVDSEASQNHHAYPKLVLPEIKCGDCGGIGKIKGSECKSCGGKGQVFNFSPVTAISIPQSFDHKNNITPSYIAAPTESLKHLFEVWQIYLDIAANSVGVDPYIHAQESGEAMKMRMQTLEKFLLNLGNAVADCIENHWNNLIKLKNPKVDNIETLLHVISRPKKILLRNDSTIKDDINNSTGAERIEYIKEYNSYKTNDERIKRAFDIYYKIYPFAGLDTVEKQFSLSNGLIEREKLKESYYALSILKELVISENPDITDINLIEKMNSRLSLLTSSNKIAEIVS